MRLDTADTSGGLECAGRKWTLKQTSCLNFVWALDVHATHFDSEQHLFCGSCKAHLAARFQGWQVWWNQECDLCAVVCFYSAEDETWNATSFKTLNEFKLCCTLGLFKGRTVYYEYRTCLERLNEDIFVYVCLPFEVIKMLMSVSRQLFICRYKPFRLGCYSLPHQHQQLQFGI